MLLGEDQNVVIPNPSARTQRDVQLLQQLHYAVAQLGQHLEAFRDWDPDHPLTRLESFQAICIIFMHHTIPLDLRGVRKAGRLVTICDATRLARETLSALKPYLATDVDSEECCEAMQVLLAWLDCTRSFLENTVVSKEATANLLDRCEIAKMLIPATTPQDD